MMIYSPNKVSPIPKKVKALCIQIKLISIQNPNEPNISQLVQINSFTHAIVHSSLLFTQSDISADTNGKTNAMTKNIPKVEPIIP